MEINVDGRKFVVTFTLQNDVQEQIFNRQKGTRDVTVAKLVEITSGGHPGLQLVGFSIRKPCDKPNRTIGRINAIRHLANQLFGVFDGTEKNNFLAGYVNQMEKKDKKFVEFWYQAHVDNPQLNRPAIF
jgi:hypothetical protein